MDCRIYLPDGQMVDVPNVLNIRAVEYFDMNKDGVAPRRCATIALFNDENTKPVATFYGAIGYQLLGRRTT